MQVAGLLFSLNLQTVKKADLNPFFPPAQQRIGHNCTACEFKFLSNQTELSLIASLMNH